MRVLYVSNMYPSHEGDYAGIFIKEQVEYLRRNFKVEPEIFVINGKRRFGNLSYFLSVFKINFKLAFTKYDKVHIHYGLSGLFLFLNFFYPKKNIFLTIHGGDIAKEQKRWVQVFLTKILIKKVNVVIAVNEKMRDLVEKRHVSSVHIPCGVDTDFFKPSELSIAAQTELRLVFPNSPKRWVKNYKLFNEISEIISEKYKVPVKQVILENCSREQVREAMQTSDCIFMTSHSEASPQVIKEALACNLPVVSVNVGDVYKSVNDLPHCYVYEHHEKDNFVKAILDIYSLKRERVDLRKRVFEMSVDQQSVCKKIWNLYAN